MPPVRKTRLRALDLFSGCGGLSLGLHLAAHPRLQFETIAAIDNWDAACQTYERNLSLRPFCEEVSLKTLNKIGLSSESLDVVVGGPPCQGFSTSGKRSLDDPRNGLVREFFNVIEAFEPKMFLMENVSGFASFQQGNLMREVLEWADRLGYKTQPLLLQSSHFGIPQRRRRFFLLGLRGNSELNLSRLGIEAEAPQEDGLFANERASGLLEAKLDPAKEMWTFDDATSDLPVIGAGEVGHEYLRPPQNDLQRYYRQYDDQPLIDHSASGHRPDFIRMMSYIPEGKSALDPAVLETIPEKIRPGRGFPNSYSRLKSNAPSPTITRNFTTPSSANCIHPTSDRALSLREGARLQSFPDWFQFEGSFGDKRLQIGNAVPPLLGKVLGELILENMGIEGETPS
jgi:DNA (cytosine-5)-methyltransferase 1